MKIIHCLNYFLPGQVAGTEMYAFSLARELIKKDMNALVLIPNYNNDNNSEYFYEGIRVIQFAETSTMDRALIMGKRQPDGVLTFIEILKVEMPDIVHFHELEWGSGITLHHVLAAKNEGFKTVMTFHLASYSCKTGSLVYKDNELCNGKIEIRKCTECYFYQQKLSSFKNSLLSSAAMLPFRVGYNLTRFNSKLATALGFPFVIQKMKDDLTKLAENCDQLVVYAKWYGRLLSLNNIPANKITYIAPGLSGKIPDGKKEDITNTVIKFVFIGRISHFKGIHLLIDAFKKLDSAKVSLDIYGKETNDDYVNDCKRKTTTMQGIEWKGPLEPSAVVDTLTQYDVFCLPSTFSEMSPLVIQEAYAAGIPVLASEVYGNAEQIKDGFNGWLFKFKDADDLANKINLLIEKPAQLALAKKNIPAVRQFNEVTDEYEVLYESL